MVVASTSPRPLTKCLDLTVWFGTSVYLTSEHEGAEADTLALYTCHLIITCIVHYILFEIERGTDAAKI